MQRSTVPILFGCFVAAASGEPRAASAQGHTGHDFHVVNRTGMDVRLTTYYQIRQQNQLHYLRIGPVVCGSDRAATFRPPPPDHGMVPIVVIAEDAKGQGWWRAYGEPSDTGKTILTFKSQTYGGGPGGFAGTIDPPSGSDRSIDITKEGFTPSPSAAPKVPTTRVEQTKVLNLDEHPFYRIVVLSKYPIGMKLRCALSTRKIAQTPSFTDYWVGEQEVLSGQSCTFFTLRKPEPRGGGRYLLRFKAQDFDNKATEWFSPDGIAAQQVRNTFSLTLRR